MICSNEMEETEDGNFRIVSIFLHDLRLGFAKNFLIKEAKKMAAQLALDQIRSSKDFLANLCSCETKQEKFDVDIVD